MIPKYGDVIGLRGGSKVMWVTSCGGSSRSLRWHGILLDPGTIPFDKDGVPFVVGKVITFSLFPTKWSILL